MISRRLLTIAALGAACLILLGSCATKKYVQQEITTTKADLSKRLDEEAARRGDLGNQIQELTALNKKNSARIDEVSGNLDASVRKIEPRIEDAKRTGTEAQGVANTALNASKENAAAFLNRNNYETIATQEVYFKLNSANLDDAAKSLLADIAKTVESNRNLLLEVQGYTDSTGDSNYNVQLSGRRVDSVVRYLIGTLKVDLHRVTTLGLGEENPVGDNKTREGRAKNRRVSVHTLGVK